MQDMPERVMGENRNMIGDRGADEGNDTAGRMIILDTNFLLIPAKFRVDVFSELEKIVNFKYRLVILDKSLKELENIILKAKKGRKGADRDAARLALSLIKAKQASKQLEIMPSDAIQQRDSVDDIIVGLAENDKSLLVATQDKELKRRLKKEGISVIVLKQKKQLVIEG